jgi:hypothetical protein
MIWKDHLKPAPPASSAGLGEIRPTGDYPLVRTLRPATQLLAPVFASAAVVAGAAAAVDQPAAYGVAERGSLTVVSAVLLSPTGGEMKGVWLDAKRPCRERRKLVVNMSIDLVRPNGGTRRIRYVRFGLVDNCAEGGPNFGFDLRPRALGLACRNGRWAPGRYSMTTRTREARSGLTASASLYRQVTAC